jgi:uncharacterized protein YdeI (YjbR/CyaY-like superfamily)
MTAKNPKVAAFLDRATRWQDEMRALRELLLDCGLTEELKWGKPCYTAQGGNIVIMQPFKAHLSLMFFKGALLSDEEGLLRSQGEATQAAWRMEFTSVDEVSRRSSALRSCIEEATAVEAVGLQVPERKVEDYEVPPEFAKRLPEDGAYREAFEALTPGRKKSYLLHFLGARQASTRERRIDACRAKVLEGKGFHER